MRAFHNIPAGVSAADVDAFVSAAEECRHQLLWLAQRLTHNREEAEDIVQEALIRAFRKLDQFRGDAKISTWLRVIVRNTAHEWLRNRGSRVFLPLEIVHGDDDEAAVLDVADRGLNPEESCARREMEAILRSEIKTLTAFSRRAIELCALEELSLREAARSLDSTVVTVKSRMFRGRRLLREGVCRRTGGKEHCFVR